MREAVSDRSDINMYDNDYDYFYEGYGKGIWGGGGFGISKVVRKITY